MLREECGSAQRAKGDARTGFSSSVRMGSVMAKRKHCVSLFFYPAGAS